MYDILLKDDASRYCGIIINGFAISQIMMDKFIRNKIMLYDS